MRKKHSPESYKKMLISRRWYKHSEETKRKLSLVNIGKQKPWARNNPQVFKKGQVPWNKGLINPQPLSMESRRKISEKLKGNKSHLWRGGITKNMRLIRTSLEYRNWRKLVFERDNYTCVWCGARNGDGKAHTLNADHIKPFSLYPELRYELSNGRTLCHSCHKKTDTYGNKIYKEIHK